MDACSCNHMVQSGTGGISALWRPGLTSLSKTLFPLQVVMLTLHADGVKHPETCGNALPGCVAALSTGLGHG